MDIKNAALIGLGAMGVFFAPRMEEHLGRENFCVIAEGDANASYTFGKKRKTTDKRRDSQWCKLSFSNLYSGRWNTDRSDHYGNKGSGTCTGN